MVEVQDHHHIRPIEVAAQGVVDLDELGSSCAQAAQVGMNSRPLAALSDAGSVWRTSCAATFNRPDVVVILDFHHPAGYLERLAWAWLGKGNDAAAAQATAWSINSSTKGGPAMLETLRGLQLPRRKEVRAAYDEALTYFSNHSHRMDYPRIRRRAGRSAVARSRVAAKQWSASG